MSSKRLCSVALVVIFFFALILVGSAHFGHAQTGTEISGSISSDTTWTPAGSPYFLYDEVGLNANVTLTIEPGTTINIGYIFAIFGEIIAKGTPTDPINITGEMIIYSSSPGYNNQTGTGSIIQNANIGDVLIVYTSPKIENCNVSAGGNDAIEVLGGSPVISNSFLNGIKVANGTPTFSNNYVTTSFGYSVDVVGGSPRLFSNNITSVVGQQQTVTGWEPITYPGVVLETAGSGLSPGDLDHYEPVNPYIVGNRIFGCSVGIKNGQGDYATIENNLFVNNTYGIAISSTKQATIVNNTIVDNVVGISLDHSPVANITDNNIEGNSQNSVYLQYTPNNVDVQLNWWGTTNTAAINQSIYDSKNNATLGTVVFTPFLTAPNSQAPVSPIASPTAEPTKTPTSTSSPSPTITPSPTPTLTPTSTISPSTATSTSPSTLPTAALSPSPSISPQLSASSQLGFYEVIAGLIVAVVVLVAVIVVVLVKVRRGTTSEP